MLGRDGAKLQASPHFVPTFSYVLYIVLVNRQRQLGLSVAYPKSLVQ